MTRPFLTLIALLAAAPAIAQTAAPNTAVRQTAAGDAQLRLIVVDQTSAGIPTATVTLTPATGEPVVVTTDERGVVNVPSLPVGGVKVLVEFSGFESVEGSFTLRRGANNQTLTMKLAGLTDEVVVTNEQVGGDTKGSAMVTTLSKEEIEALPETEEDLQAYLEQLAGPGGATFFLNGFRGGRLPTREEIRSIRIRQNSFSADGHESGGRSGIEIITRPSTQSFSGQVQLQYRGDSLNARHAQSMVETPEGNRQVELAFRGPIVPGKTSFSMNVSGRSSYEANTSLALDPAGNRIGSQVRVPSDQKGFNASLEHALTGNSTLRLSYQRSQQEGRNQGLGQYDLPERASERNSSGDMVRGQIQGILRGNMLNEFRVQFNRQASASLSVSDAPTIIVQDAFGIGGAGVNNRNVTNSFEIADNFDFTPHRNHQMRVGLLLEGGYYHYFDQTNAFGRTTYASLEDYTAGRPLQFSQRLGLVDNSFNQYQLGFYIQDEFRVNNRLTVGVGVRNEMQTRISDKLNLMPRIGFSLNPGGNSTSIRGGYGIYYDWYEASLYDQTLRLNGVAQRELQINFVYDEEGNLLNQVTPGERPSNRTVAAPDLEMPYVHQASLGVERQLAETMSVQVTYQRLTGVNQLRGRDINYGFLQGSLETGDLVRVRPDATSGIVTQIESTGRSVSNRLTTQLRKQLRSASGQQIGFLQVSYQLGEVKSNFNGATSLPSNSDDLDLDWGPQGQDIRHQFQVGGNVRLPYDFRLQSNLQLRSAPAYNLTTGRDDNFDGVINDRPIGEGRNSLRGESTWNVTQLSLNKVFGFGGTREGTGGTGGTGGPGGGGNFPRGGNFNNQQGGGGGFPGAGGGGFQGGGRRDGGAWGGNASNARYQIQFSVQAQNPLNRAVRTGWTGNMLSRYFGTPTGVQNARRISFNTSFRF